MAEVNESVPASRRLLGVHGGVVHWNSMARKTPLRKPNRGEGIVSTKRKPRSVYDLSWFNVLLHYYAALLPRRGPHIASHSVCLSVRPVIVASRRAT